MYQKYFKRFLDLTLSLSLIVILLPVFTIIFFLVWCFIGYPLFAQLRPGLNEKIFKIYKFKTLYDKGDNLEDFERQNRFGNFLRKTGLDELPQLFNVVKNNMSLIGPRPLLSEYLVKYSNFEKKRHLVKPGITGLAQVFPRQTNKKNWKKNFELDIYYVENISFSLDLKIIIKTILLILLKKKLYKDFEKFNEQ